MNNQLDSNLLLSIKKQVKSYLIGFTWSLILTIISFFCIKNHFFCSNTNSIVVILSAIIQIIVHFIYFLHLNDSNREYWNLVSLLFSLVIIFIIIFGSIWIMYHLNHHTILFG